MSAKESSEKEVKNLNAFYTALAERSKLNGQTEARDELGGLTIETYTTKVGVVYKVVKREDQPILIFHLSQTSDFKKLLMKRVNGSVQ